jgi:hypothetical protein
MDTNSIRIRRFRGTRRRLEQLKLTDAEKLAALAITAFCLFCAIASAWLVVNFRE